MLKTSLICLSLLVIPQLANAASTAYLKIGDIKGESQRVDHEDEIDIISWSWGAESNRKAACIEDIKLVKYVDRSSPLLLLGQANQARYPTAVLSVRKDSGEAHLDYLVITMTNVQISRFDASGTAGDGIPTEAVSLTFDNLEYQYTVQADDHSAGEVVSATVSSGRCN
ncbi:Hcp family type VI secretion system effector [Kangiella koreensis]|uniref:Type VI secretion system effector, Hcp1 family n=1 Tax=Kangiella koreensis (strain DSM 16069 / JCM 12317 / KCTC 12182 / SW-125) TaxID=523791 RepID=C7R833_KANKD|nr:type VI secretion system tube protein Hcp [Kangiella koreensis]ACV25815.1 protein of unknown function DUF796 [Kangiella koreensis DSM 16069]